MVRPRFGLKGAICALGLITAACSSRAPVATLPAVAATTVAAAPAAPAPQPHPHPTPHDPVADLIAESTRLFDAGQRELEDGHLQEATAYFNQSLEVLLQSEDGARTEPRTRDYFDQLVERISALEAAALAKGDGFDERMHEPASIDEVLALSTFAQPVPTPETTEAVVADLEFTLHDIEIPLNDRVLSYVELFSGRLKSYLEDGLNRGAQYLPMIQTVFRAEGLPQDLAYVPLIESAFKPTAVSRAKAAGIWQFMRGTALENGLKHDWYIDERADPEKATWAAARYLKTLYGMFGDWHLALAAYNGGPGRVQRAMKRSGKTDFWSLSARSGYLPKETRDYVPLILAAAIVAKNPEQYGLSVVAPPEERPFERVVLPRPVDLRKVAEWVDVPVQTIQALNPELRRWTTPLGSDDYKLKVPTGTAEMVRARLAEADPSELVPLNYYTVKKGDTLSGVANALRVSRADLASANYISPNARLQIGQQLIVPREPASVNARAAATPRAQSVRAQAAPAPTSGAKTGSSVVHRVKSGETLYGIAQLYRVTVDSLKSWNRLTSNIIRPGQRLTILASATLATN